MIFGNLMLQFFFYNITYLLNQWNIEYAPPKKNNLELQSYDNTAFKFNNSNLIIVTHKNNKNIVSGRINTKNKIEIQYGYIEILMKFSEGKGLWPAFWMLGNNNKWPLCGEIDIIEWVGWNEKNIYGTLHGPQYYGGNPYGSGPINIYNKSLYNEYHKYAIEWKPNNIKWFIDDILFFTASKNKLQKINKNYEWVFNDKFFYLILNMAVGGEFGGAFYNSNNYIYNYLPEYSELIIQYIKIYKTIDGYGEIKYY
jgi:beta-glucanase (GH16 family)